MAIEFEINGQMYRATKLDAMRQFHLSRKIAPIIPKLIPVFVRFAKDGEKMLAGDITEFAETLVPFANALAEMTDEHAEFVVNTCLSAVSRQTGTNYSQVMRNNVCMFDDIDLGVTMPIVFKVLWDNLGNFISGLLSNAPTKPGPAA